MQVIDLFWLFKYSDLTVNNPDPPLGYKTQSFVKYIVSISLVSFLEALPCARIYHNIIIIILCSIDSSDVNAGSTSFIWVLPYVYGCCRLQLPWLRVPSWFCFNPLDLCSQSVAYDLSAMATHVPMSLFHSRQVSTKFCTDLRTNSGKVLNTRMTPPTNQAPLPWAPKP